MTAPSPSLLGPPCPGMMSAAPWKTTSQRCLGLQGEMCSSHDGAHSIRNDSTRQIRIKGRLKTDKDTRQASVHRFYVMCSASPGAHRAVMLGVFQHDNKEDLLPFLSREQFWREQVGPKSTVCIWLWNVKIKLSALLVKMCSLFPPLCILYVYYKSNF